MAVVDGKFAGVCVLRLLHTQTARWRHQKRMAKETLKKCLAPKNTAKRCGNNWQELVENWIGFSMWRNTVVNFLIWQRWLGHMWAGLSAQDCATVHYLGVQLGSWMGATTNHQKLEYKPPTTLVICNIHLQLELGLHPRLGYMLNPCLYKTTARASYSPLVLQASVVLLLLLKGPCCQAKGVHSHTHVWGHGSHSGHRKGRAILAALRKTVQHALATLCLFFKQGL